MLLRCWEVGGRYVLCSSGLFLFHRLWVNESVCVRGCVQFIWPRERNCLLACWYVSQRATDQTEDRQGLRVSCDGLCFPEAARSGEVLQVGQRAADDLLGSVYDPLHRLPVPSCGACEPHTQAVCYALHRGVIEGQQQLCVQVVLPEDAQEVKPLLSLLH